MLRDYYLIVIIVLPVVALILFVVFWMGLAIKRLSCENKELNDKLSMLKEQLKGMNSKYEPLIEHQQSDEPKTDILLRSQQYVTSINEISQHISLEGNQTPELIITDNKQQLPSYNYLQEANCGKFIKLLQVPDKCFFRTWLDGDVRKFEFCGNVAKALANINAIFDDVCEIEGKRSGATDIENVTAGTLDSELRIIRKAKIKLK